MTKIIQVKKKMYKSQYYFIKDTILGTSLNKPNCVYTGL